MTVPAEIETMIARVAQRDLRAFARLYDATSAQVYGLICNVLHVRDAQEAALRDTYSKVWHIADRYAESGQSALAWLTFIARNIAVDRFQRLPPTVNTFDDVLAQIYWRGDTYGDLAMIHCVGEEDMRGRVADALDALHGHLTR